MKRINSIALKHSAETLQAGSAAVVTIAMLLRANGVESADVDGKPFLSDYTEDGLFAAIDVIGTALANAAEALHDVIDEASKNGLIISAAPTPQPAGDNTGGGA